VRGSGFAFKAPAGWTVTRREGVTAAASGKVDRVEVRVFPLARRYDPSRFAEAAGELDGIAVRLARQLDGRVVERETVLVTDRKARSYRIEYDGKAQQLTFVLNGRREYQLLCRRAVDGDDGPCLQLVESFVLR
jgi:hypothetical protein